MCLYFLSLDTGLITPILSQAEGKGLSSISNQVKELAGRAREGKLAPHEYQVRLFVLDYPSRVRDGRLSKK